MNAVITADEARAITGGRAPLVPVEYETAIKALQACRNIDDAKYWSDKASALAAWAKIYHSRQVMREARLLKLHAYRHMAELAHAIRDAAGKGRIRTILEEKGLSVTEARQIDGVGRIPKEQFERALASPRPAAPWAFSRGGEVSELKPLRSMHTMAKRAEAHEIAKLIDGKSREVFCDMIDDITEWLDELQQRLQARANN
jgi:hypothetical protein